MNDNTPDETAPSAPDASAAEVWTSAEAAAWWGVGTAKTIATTLRRRGIKPLPDRRGPRGESLYYAAEVRASKAARPPTPGRPRKAPAEAAEPPAAKPAATTADAAPVAELPTEAAPTGRQYVIKYGRTTNHIAGIAERGKYRDSDSADVVRYYAQSACPALSRSGARLATGQTFTSLSEAVSAMETTGGRKLCKTCQRAAEAQLAAELATRTAEAAPTETAPAADAAPEAEPNAIRTATNSHYLMGNGTVCNPKRLPKGELFVTGPQHDENGNWTGLPQVVCNRCNKVDPYGRG